MFSLYLSKNIHVLTAATSDPMFCTFTLLFAHPPISPHFIFTHLSPLCLDYICDKVVLFDGVDGQAVRESLSKNSLASLSVNVGNK